MPPKDPDFTSVPTATPQPAAPPQPAAAPTPAVTPERPSALRSWWRRAVTVRDVPPAWETWLLGLLSVLTVGGVWWVLTRPGHRLVDAYTLPNPEQTFRSFKSLWFERELSISALTSLGRVLGGFLVSTSIAVPLGIIAGSYVRVNAFLRPISIFGRNVPVAALIPLTLIWFGLGEVQKIMFIFLATVAFVLFDTTNAVLAVPGRYLDTAYTLGMHRTLKKGARLAALFGLIYGSIAAFGWFWLDDSSGSLTRELSSTGFWGRFLGAGLLGFCLWLPIEGHQVLRKVLMPLALPDIVNSLRLIFGLAFGYIMLAEVINAHYGLGSLIIMSQRQGPREHIYLCLIIISLLAWGIDRGILRLQRHLFPHLKNGET
jgi:ABC-type nitrate/sulfonate/bicarbonate transport system permease component